MRTNDTNNRAVTVTRAADSGGAKENATTDTAAQWSQYCENAIKTSRGGTKEPAKGFP